MIALNGVKIKDYKVPGAVCKHSLNWGALKLTGENLQLVWAEFSSIS